MTAYPSHARARASCTRQRDQWRCFERIVEPLRQLAAGKQVESPHASRVGQRRVGLGEVRATILKHPPKGFADKMQYGMIGYVVPRKVYPPGYHCDARQPRQFAALASRKNYMALYQMSIYQDPEMERWFRGEFKARGLKLDMGKCRVRFRKLDDLPLDVMGEAIARVPVADYIRRYEGTVKRTKK